MEYWKYWKLFNGSSWLFIEKKMINQLTSITFKELKLFEKVLLYQTSQWLIFLFCVFQTLELFIEIPQYIIRYTSISAMIRDITIMKQKWNQITYWLQYCHSFFKKMQRIRSYKYFNHIMQCFFICECPPWIVNALSVCTFCTFNPP